jgi:CheY-like chemotaxis protein
MAFQGAGLGLAISKAYAELMGSEIHVDSEPGSGSRFYFSLPIHHMAKEETDRQDIEATEEEIKQVTKMKLLIVEDDTTSVLLLREMVSDYCREILTAGTGIEAIDQCRQNPDIDLVLMDIQMPEMNGYIATAKIREFNREVPIIAQTAFALSGDRDKALSMGCNDYIPKPINRKKLKDIILKHLPKMHIH